MGVKVLAEILNKEEIIKDIYRFTIKTEEIASVAKPGQFLEIKVSDGIEPLLRRPISIFNVDREAGIVEFIVMVRGKGTKILCERQVGEKLNILGPLGNGSFLIGNYKEVSIIGGGIGIYPLYELCKQIKEKDIKINTYLGFRNKDLVHLENEFKEISDNLIITTDDGSYGKKGFAIEYLKENCLSNKPDAIYACGPLLMIKAIQEFSKKSDIHAQISLEERMGCGIGACLGCAVKTIKDGKESYLHVCKNGPVFNAESVEI